MPISANNSNPLNKPSMSPNTATGSNPRILSPGSTPTTRSGNAPLSARNLASAAALSNPPTVFNYAVASTQNTRPNNVTSLFSNTAAAAVVGGRQVNGVRTVSTHSTWGYPSSIQPPRSSSISRGQPVLDMSESEFPALGAVVPSTTAAPPPSTTSSSSQNTTANAVTHATNVASSLHLGTSTASVIGSYRKKSSEFNEEDFPALSGSGVNTPERGSHSKTGSLNKNDSLLHSKLPPSEETSMNGAPMNREDSINDYSKPTVSSLFSPKAIKSSSKSSSASLPLISSATPTSLGSTGGGVSQGGMKQGDGIIAKPLSPEKSYAKVSSVVQSPKVGQYTNSNTSARSFSLTSQSSLTHSPDTGGVSTVMGSAVIVGGGGSGKNTKSPRANTVLQNSMLIGSGTNLDIKSFSSNGLTSSSAISTATTTPPTPMTTATTTTTATTRSVSKRANTEKFGLLELSDIFAESAGSDVNLLMDGGKMDQIGLRMDLGVPMLHTCFTSPWTEPSLDLLGAEYYLPNSYSVMNLPPPQQKMGSFSDGTLFYIFYTMPRDLLQEAAAQELYNRNWRYHKDLRLWLTKDPGASEPLQKTETYERGRYQIFDTQSWRKVTQEMILVYEALEERPTLINGGQHSVPTVAGGFITTPSANPLSQSSFPALSAAVYGNAGTPIHYAPPPPPPPPHHHHLPLHHHPQIASSSSLPHAAVLSSGAGNSASSGGAGGGGGGSYLQHPLLGHFLTGSGGSSL